MTNPNPITLFYTLSFKSADGCPVVFYIGRTGISLAKRFYGHQRDALKQKTAKGRFMAELINLGYTIEITEIKRVNTYDKDVVSVIEDKLIVQFSEAGHKLYNVAKGNNGNIPGCSIRINWEPILPLLGTMFDLDIAKMFHTEKATIGQKRKSLGIPSYESTILSELRSNTHLLGTRTDVEIASQFGVSKSAVVQLRQELGISAKFQPVAVDWERYTTLIGTMSDLKLANLIGCQRDVVRRKRTKLGIPAFNR